MYLFSFRGIPIRLHWSFLALGGVYLLLEALAGGLSAAMAAGGLAVLVFGSVLLHELGHAMAGRAFGIPTRDITLYPFGGVASMQVQANRPKVELLVALAGPAVNLVLAALGLVALQLGVAEAGLFVVINLVMGIFNLLPAYPMDGGRVLRAYWTLRGEPVEATMRALKLSRWFAWGFIVLGLFGSPSLILVGAFLLFVIGAERRRWLAMMRHGWIRASDTYRQTIPPRVLSAFEHPAS